jgi:hypothetical protein
VPQGLASLANINPVKSPLPFRCTDDPEKLGEVILYKLSSVSSLAKSSDF